MMSAASSSPSDSLSSPNVKCKPVFSPNIYLIGAGSKSSDGSPSAHPHVNHRDIFGSDTGN